MAAALAARVPGAGTRVRQEGCFVARAAWLLVPRAPQIKQVAERLGGSRAAVAEQLAGGAACKCARQLTAGPHKGGGSRGGPRKGNQSTNESPLPASAGNIADVLYGASLIPNFAFFDTSYQALTGTLPNINLPNMQILDLSNNYLSVCAPLRGRPGHARALLHARCFLCPANWGANRMDQGSRSGRGGRTGARSWRRKGGLVNNWECDSVSQGTIPASWGLQASMPNMRNLTLANNAMISGTLPAVRTPSPQ